MAKATHIRMGGFTSTKWRRPGQHPRRASAVVARAAGMLCPLLVLALSACSGPPAASARTPVVTIGAVSDSAVAGTPLEFAVRAKPAPAADLPVWIDVAAEPAGCVPGAGSRVRVMINARSGESVHAVPTTGTAACEVSVTVIGGTGYEVGDPAKATVSVTGQEAPPMLEGDPVVTIEAGQSGVAWGGEVSFTLNADRQLPAALEVMVEWSGTDSLLPPSPPEMVTIAANSRSVTLTAETVDAGVDGDVTVTVASGEGYTVGDPASATVAVSEDPGSGSAGPGSTGPGSTDPSVPAVTVSGPSSVTEGAPVVFTFTASGTLSSDLAVAVQWASQGNFVSGTLPGASVTIPTSGSVTVTVETVADSVQEAHGSITVTVQGGDGYRVGSQASATVIVEDDDQPSVTIAEVTATVTEGNAVSFTLTASPPPGSPLTVNVSWFFTSGVLDGSPPSTYTMNSASLPISWQSATTEDGDRQVTVVVNDGTGYTVGTPSSARVIVTD